MVTHDAEVVDFAGPWGVFEYAAVPGYTDPAWSAVHGVAALSIEHALRDHPALALAERMIDAMVAGFSRAR